MADPDGKIRELAARRRLPQVQLERWLQLDAASRTALLEFALALKPRTGQLVAMLDLVDEIAVREKTDVAGILSRSALRRLLAATGSAPERAHALLDQLRTMRFPRLRKTIERLEAAIAAMRLPRGIAVLLPRELASDELTIQLKVADAKELGRLLEILVEKRAQLERILTMIGGGDEVRD
jgi:hypothetical protein